MNYIVYQAYGNKDNLNECLYSLYSCEGKIGNAKVFVYTDNEAYLKKMAPIGLQITYRNLSKEEIAEWKGENNFVHRLKVKMLIDMTNSIELNGANILYLDCDTKIRSSLTPVFTAIEDGKLFMHLDEGEIESPRNNRIFKKIIRFRDSEKKHSGLIPKGQRMWNAGCLGFNSSSVKGLQKVLLLTDNIYEELPIHVIEQLAFSIVFSDLSENNLIPLEQEVYHYWNFKEYRKVLDTFFQKNTTAEAITSEIVKIDPEVMITPKTAYEELPMIRKFLKKLQGKWELQEYK